MAELITRNIKTKGKEKKTCIFTMRIERSVIERLKVAAKEDELPVQTHVRSLIVTDLNKRRL